MTPTYTGLIMPRRKLLLGATALAALPLAAPHIARAADPIKIGLLLAKTGGIAAQTEYLANGTYLALEERNNMIMGQPTELVCSMNPARRLPRRTCRSWCRRTRLPRFLGIPVVQRAGRGSHRRAVENPVRVRQRRSDGNSAARTATVTRSG